MLRLLIGAILVGFASPAVATTGSGLYGKVTRGPIAPVCTVGKPCSAPAPGITLSFVRNAKTVARVESGRYGLYRVALAPGIYTVREVAQTTMKPPMVKPLVVRVRVGTWTRLDVTVDTGIR